MCICVFELFMYIHTHCVFVCVRLFFVTVGLSQKPRPGAAGGCAATWFLCSFGGYLVGGFMGFV